MHACGTPLPTHSDAKLEHLLVPLLVAVLGAPGAIPAPFRVAGVLPSLVQRSWGAALARAPPSPGQLPTGRERGLLPRLDRQGEGFERDSAEPKGPVDGLLYTKSLLPAHRYMMRRPIDHDQILHCKLS